MIIAVLYTFAVFVSSFLLFCAQPMLTKLALPALGGTSMVWNTCAVFFQSALLLGYLYSHLLSRYVAAKLAPAVHAILLLGLLSQLPDTFHFSFSASEAIHVALLKWLVLSFSYAAIALSASAPLLQRWYAEIAPGKNPYPLYVASNLGSLGGLASYPFWIEPSFGLSAQSKLLFYGLHVFVISLFLCAFFRFVRPVAKIVPHEQAKGETPQIVAWLALAFLPSALCLSVTTHITTNVSPVPLLWVLPLSLYLLSFILAFGEATRILRPLEKVFPYFLLLFVPFAFYEMPRAPVLMFCIHLGLLFVTASVFAGRLYALRPSAERLTEFYLYLAAGGLLGGLFATFLAPVLFSEVTEYPLLVGISALAVNGRRTIQKKDFRVFCAFAVALLLLHVSARMTSADLKPLQFMCMFGLPALLLVSLKQKPLVFAAGLGLLFVSVSEFEQSTNRAVVLQRRNFYGVKKVSEDTEFRYLVHGGTIHGVYAKREGGSLQPAGYYALSGPFGDAEDIMRRKESVLRVGGIGLGIGGIAPYAKLNDRIDFWELDQQIADIAADERFFGYLSSCGARCSVEIGDGRILLSKQPGPYDVIFIDAFSSDSIPLHLLSVEAIEMYLSKLRPGGIVLFNISNRYLDLSIPLARIAKELNLIALRRADFSQSEADIAQGKLSAIFLTLVPSADLAREFEAHGWQTLESEDGAPLWTDDYSNLWQVFRAFR